VTEADDGMDVYVDGQMIGENTYGSVSASPVLNYGNIYNNEAGAVPTAFSPVTLTAGTHSVEIMYYQGWPVDLAAQVWMMPVNTSYISAAAIDSNLMKLGPPVNGQLNCPH
jgi:hypothetical protein